MVLGTSSGLIILLGVIICVAGIGVAGLAGISKEKEMTPDQKTAVITEFNLKKGLLVATFCGIMSACFSYGLAVAGPIRALTMQHGTSELWQGLPALVVVLWGGATTNVIWCVILNLRNKSYAEYFGAEIPTERIAVEHSVTERGARAPLLRNYLFCAVAGTVWYFQFFFYTMGETQMGAYRFSSWTLHMASIMIFGSLLGLALKEWRGAGRRTMALLTLSIATLVLSTVVVGYGNYKGNEAKATSASVAPITRPAR